MRRLLPAGVAVQDEVVPLRTHTILNVPLQLRVGMASSLLEYSLQFIFTLDTSCLCQLAANQQETSQSCPMQRPAWCKGCTTSCTQQP